jgi:glucuronate isomerase
VNLEVHINGHRIYCEAVSYRDIEVIAEALRDHYKIDLLKAVGVNAEICVSEVQSKMNFPFFQEKAEWYDRVIDDQPTAMAV